MNAAGWCPVIVRTINRAPRAVATPRWRREFRALWWAEAVSLVGDQLTRVAISMLVFQRTSSAWLTAVTYAMTYVPDSLGGLLFSGMADRFPRRELMVISCTIQAFLVAAIALPNLPTWLVVVLVSASVVFLAPFKAAQTAVVREVASEDADPDRAYAHATSSLGIMREAGLLIGLAVAGVVISTLGVATALLVDAATFLAAAVLLMTGLRRRPASHSRHGPRAKWEHDARHAPLVAFILVCACTVLPYGLIAPLVDELDAPHWATGLILAADPAGIVIAGFLLKRYVSLATQQRWMGTLACVSLAALIPMAVVHHWSLAAVLLFASGAGAAYTFTAKALFQNLIPNHLAGFAAGRVRAGLRMSQGMVLLVGGLLAHQIGTATQTIAAVAGVGAVLCVVTEFVWRRRRDEPRVPRTAQVMFVMTAAKIRMLYVIADQLRATDPPRDDRRGGAELNGPPSATKPPTPAADSGNTRHPLGKPQP